MTQLSKAGSAKFMSAIPQAARDLLDAGGLKFDLSTMELRIPYQGSSVLFTLAQFPGVLFKQVSSWEELDASASFMFSDASCIRMAGAIGLPVYGTPLVKISGSTVYTFYDGNPAGLYGISSELRSRVLPTPIKITADNQAAVGPNYVGDTITSITTRSTTSSTTDKLNFGGAKFVFAIMAQCDAGMLYAHPNISNVKYGSGWLSTHLDLGPLQSGIDAAYKDMMTDAPSDIKGYLQRAYQQLTAEGLFKYHPKLGLVTYFGGSHDSTQQFPMSPGYGGKESVMFSPSRKIGFGAAYVVPATSVKARYTSYGVPILELYQDCLVPSLSSGYVIPPLCLCEPTNIPFAVRSAVAARHRLAAAAPNGRLYPLSTGMLASGSWKQYATALEQISLMSTGLNNLAAAGVPAGATAENFNPSLSMGEDLSDYAAIYGLNGNLVTGDFLAAYKSAIDMIYNRAEQIMRDEN